MIQHERSHPSEHLTGSDNEAGLCDADTDQKSKPGRRDGGRSISSCPYRVTRQRGNSGGDQFPAFFAITHAQWASAMVPRPRWTERQRRLVKRCLYAPHEIVEASFLEDLEA